MTRDEVRVILAKPTEEIIDIILALAEKADKYDRLCGNLSPTTPSGMIPPYLKPARGNPHKKPGRKKGHKGVSRTKPDKVNNFKEHTLHMCPFCRTSLGKPIKRYTRYTTDIPMVEPEVTEHTVHGYWCAHCKKIVFPKVTDALPHAMIGIRLVVFTAWLHYLIGVSVNNIVNAVFTTVKVTPGGLTQSWNRLASLLEPIYDDIGQKVANSAVLHSDETGWRINGLTHWLWCFATKTYCYYVISKCRGSPVVKNVLGRFFNGILICDFWGAYNKISTLAKQRCLYHLFTELVKVDKQNSSPHWKAFRKKLSRLLKDAIRLSNRKNHMDSKIFERRKNKLFLRLDQFLKTTYKDKDAKRLIKRLKRHRNELFTFILYEGVSPYNNHAEQQLRKPVLTRKISQQNRSEQGAKTQAILMSLFRSAELQGINPVYTILSYAKNAIDPESKLDEIGKLAA